MFAWRRKAARPNRDVPRPRWSLAWLFNRSTSRSASAAGGGKEQSVSGLQHRNEEPGSWPGGAEVAGVGVSTAGLTLPVAELVGDAGLGMSEQSRARLRRTVESEIIPRLLLAHRTAQPPSLASIAPRQVLEFVDLLLSDSEDAPLRFAIALRGQGVGVADIYVELLGPAARELGEMWCQDRCSFALVTLGLVRLQQVVHMLSPWLSMGQRRAGSGRSVLLAAVPGEQHTFGMSVAAEFFKSDGWSVLFEPAAGRERLAAMVGSRWLDVIGVSCSTHEMVDEVALTIRELRAASQNANALVLVGGRVFVNDPTQAVRVGADAVAGDVRQLMAQVQQLMNAVRERP